MSVGTDDVPSSISPGDGDGEGARWVSSADAIQEGTRRGDATRREEVECDGGEGGEGGAVVCK